MMRLTARHESWPLASAFTISRGSRTTAEVVVVELERDGVRGHAECVPYARYGESVDGVLAALHGLAAQLPSELTHAELQGLLPAGAARNALDCALWDWRAQAGATTVAAMVGLEPLQALTTAYTVSLDTPERMGAVARANAHRPVLKSKLAGAGDLERMAAVRENAPAARLIVDANEGWTTAVVEQYCAALAELGVALVEQPLPAGQDAVLAQVAHPVALCADESCHTSRDLEHLCGRYDVVNIKLEKTGGLTEAMEVRRRARELGFGVMVGCMVGTSLAMAPAALVAQGADYVDLDGPLLLARDRDPGLVYSGSVLQPRTPGLWG